jgi:hypothetical protein
MPDFSGLRLAAEEAARQPDFDTVRNRAIRLRRRRRLTVAGGGAGALALLLAVAASLTNAFTGPEHEAAPRPSTTATIPKIPPGQPLADSYTFLSGMMGDSGHVYVVAARTCKFEVDCQVELLASDDAGRTWSSRGPLPPEGQDDVFSELEPLGPLTLSTVGGGGKQFGTVRGGGKQFASSADAGATWRRATVTETPIEVVPAGYAIASVSVGGRAGVLYALDPVRAVLAPLATQPPIVSFWASGSQEAAGLWVTGWERGTFKPAVSISRDRGRTWTSHVFTELPALPSVNSKTPDWFAVPRFASRDGLIGYVSVWQSSASRRIYRTPDGGARWRAIEAIGITDGSMYVAADGAFVSKRTTGSIETSPNLRYQKSVNGEPATPFQPAGLPPSVVGSPKVAPDGTVSVFEPATGTMYVSDDGLTYRELPAPHK